MKRDCHGIDIGLIASGVGVGKFVSIVVQILCRLALYCLVGERSVSSDLEHLGYYEPYGQSTTYQKSQQDTTNIYIYMIILFNEVGVENIAGPHLTKMMLLMRMRIALSFVLANRCLYSTCGGNLWSFAET